MRHVVIIGGGFGGLAAAQALRGAGVRITLVDRRNHHLFQPLLYQVATAGLAPSDIAEPIRGILAGRDDVSVRLGHVEEVDLEGRRVRVTPVPGPRQTVAALAPTEWIAYDALIVAAGVRHAYFGHDAWAEHAPGLKTIGDALEIRRRVLTAFERAEWTEDPDERAACTTFVVVGAGPTGVELAGALREIALRTLRRDFRSVRTEQARVVLVEAGPAVLAAFAPELQARARSQLERLGVEVRLGAPVTEVDPAGVALADGTRVRAATVLWAAGVAGAPVARTLGLPLDRAGRVFVEPDCSLPGHPEVFVIGDLAHLVQDGAPLPGVAPVAQQQGRFVAAALRADPNGAARGRFRYVDRGAMATIGRSKAVLQSGRVRLWGWLAWVLWVFVHLMVLVTFRNRVLVFVKWAWAWLTYERASRLIWQGEGPADEERSG